MRIINIFKFSSHWTAEEKNSFFVVLPWRSLWGHWFQDRWRFPRWNKNKNVLKRKADRIWTWWRVLSQTVKIPIKSPSTRTSWPIYFHTSNISAYLIPLITYATYSTFKLFKSNYYPELSDLSELFRSSRT